MQEQPSELAAEISQKEFILPVLVDRTLGSLFRYLAQMSNGRQILWCYFIWYLVTLSYYFDPSPNIWLTSFGLSIIVGFALYLNARSAAKGPVNLEFWQTARFYMTPFCVSSFSALVKDRGFLLIFPGRQDQLMACVGSCILFCLIVTVVKRLAARGN